MTQSNNMTTENSVLKLEIFFVKCSSYKTKIKELLLLPNLSKTISIF